MGFGKKLIIILAVIVAFLGVCSLMIVVIRIINLKKKFYQVKSNKVVDNIRIVALADLHLKGFGKDNEKTCG